MLELLGSPASIKLIPDPGPVGEEGRGGVCSNPGTLVVVGNTTSVRLMLPKKRHLSLGVPLRKDRQFCSHQKPFISSSVGRRGRLIQHGGQGECGQGFERSVVI